MTKPKSKVIFITTLLASILLVAASMYRFEKPLSDSEARFVDMINCSKSLSEVIQAANNTHADRVENLSEDRTVNVMFGSSGLMIYFNDENKLIQLDRGRTEYWAYGLKSEFLGFDTLRSCTE